MIYTAWSGYRIVILLIITMYNNNKVVVHIASYYIDNDTIIENDIYPAYT